MCCMAVTGQDLWRKTLQTTLGRLREQQVVLMVGSLPPLTPHCVCRLSGRWIDRKRGHSFVFIRRDSMHSIASKARRKGDSQVKPPCCALPRLAAPCPRTTKPSSMASAWKSCRTRSCPSTSRHLGFFSFLHFAEPCAWAGMLPFEPWPLQTDATVTSD